MKKHCPLICIIAVLLPLYACRSSSQESPADARSSAYIDSLHCKDHSIYIEQIDSNDYLKLESPRFTWVDRNDLPDYGKGKPEDSTMVYYSDTLYRDPDNGQVDSAAKFLVMKIQTGGDLRLMSFLSHRAERNYYVKEIKELNSYLTVFSDADDMRFYLFNKANGHQSVLNGYPVISPDGKIICCVPRECNGVGNCVSFYVYSFADGIATLRCEKRDSFLGYPDLKWKGNHILYMKIYQAADTFSDKHAVQKTWYAKLDLKE